MKHILKKGDYTMLKTISYIVTMHRSRQIIEILRKNHNFDISEDLESIKLVMLLVKVSPYSNKKIVKEFLEMHTVSFKKEMFTTKK
jgi:hypothetical protein